MEEKRQLQWQKARKESAQAVDLYEQFCFLYGCMLEQLTLVNTKDATLRDRAFAEQEVQTALDYLQQLPIAGLKTDLAAIKKSLPNLFTFLDTAKAGIEELAKIVEPTALPFWLRAWQRLKNAYKIKANYQKVKRIKEKVQQDLDLLAAFYAFEDNSAFNALTNTIFRAIDTCANQASAAVENVNSFIRPYINQARDQVQQHTLNLLMFYYNHRQFERGKKKGQAPIEILTGKKLTQSWSQILLNKVRKA
jgi:hypothetical protein